MDFPFLTVITFTPIVAAILILFTPQDSSETENLPGISTKGTAVKIIAVVATLISLILSGYVYYGVNQAYATGTDEFFMFTDGRWDWVASIGIGYHLGVDGISAPMVLLTGLASVAGVLISWGINDRPREFFAFFLLLTAGVYGVFVALDLFLLFFFYELAVFPMYIMIAMWGWKERRIYASMKLTLFILAGSVVSFVGIMAMYYLIKASGMTASFDMLDFMAARDAGVFSQVLFESPLGAVTFAQMWFPFVFMGFAILAGLFPFHNWSPDGHVAAPTAVSMIHAGVLMKLGAYAALRVGVFLLPDGAVTHLPWMVLLATVNVVYGSVIALVQRDFKYVIGFSSVSHMGLVSLGFATMNLDGMTGAGLQMFSHGVMTALFFVVVGVVYDRAHTRDIPTLSGMWHKMPLVAAAFVIGGLASMGMPPLSGFIAEFPIFVGLWRASQELTLASGVPAFYYAVIAIICVLGIVVTAAYVLRVAGRVFFGDFEAARWHDEITDATLQDKFAIALLGVWLVVLGIAPSIMQPMVSSAMEPIVRLLGGA